MTIDQAIKKFEDQRDRALEILEKEVIGFCKPHEYDRERMYIERIELAEFALAALKEQAEAEQRRKSMTERNLVAVSIKHSEYRWKFGMPLILWGHRTPDDGKRSFGGYTQYPNNAEAYSMEDWQNSAYVGSDIMKIDEPVHLEIKFCKKYRKYDTVLVPLEEIIGYYKMACLALDRPEGD